MIIVIQIALIIALELGLQSWLWVAGVPLAFGLASGASTGRATWRGALAGGAAWLGMALYFYLTSAEHHRRPRGRHVRHRRRRRLAADVAYRPGGRPGRRPGGLCRRRFAGVQEEKARIIRSPGVTTRP